VPRVGLPRVSALVTRFTIVVFASIGAYTACGGDTDIVEPAETHSAKHPKSQPADTGTTPTAPTTTSGTNVLASAVLYVDPYSNAKKTADSWRTTRPADALQMDKIAAQSEAQWFGDWTADIYSAVNAATTTVTTAGALPVFVAYNIPQRDCGGLSGGNSVAADQYRQWIADFARGIGARRAVVVLEPDALAGMDCLSATDQQLRLALLGDAVRSFKSLGATFVYLDAGNPRWHSASTMATRLTQAGIVDAAGFSLNVSNFFTTSDNLSYGSAISALLGSKHFIIDTGRNGLGPTADFQWCNPDGRALGNRPTAQTGNVLVDGFLWIKHPGESDGACNGAPAAGAWMPEYALGLAQRASF
jgi:endoglucanase